jgi:hypothetical protein
VKDLLPGSGGVVLKELLKRHQDSILEKWVQLTIETYPAESLDFLKNVKDRFQNPVGHTLHQEIAVLFEALVDGMDPQDLALSLDRIVRIRSVQDFPPAQAVAFVFLLKNIIREEFLDLILQGELLDELLEFESKIDGLVLAAFDNYVKCKIEIFEIRARDAHRRTEKLVERINRISSEKKS